MILDFGLDLKLPKLGNSVSIQMTTLAAGWWLPGELGEGFWILVWETIGVTDYCCLLPHQRREDRAYASPVLDSV